MGVNSKQYNKKDIIINLISFFIFGLSFNFGLNNHFYLGEFIALFGISISIILFVFKVKFKSFFYKNYYLALFVFDVLSIYVMHVLITNKTGESSFTIISTFILVYLLLSIIAYIILAKLRKIKENSYIKNSNEVYDDLNIKKYLKKKDYNMHIYVLTLIPQDLRV